VHPVFTKESHSTVGLEVGRRNAQGTAHSMVSLVTPLRQPAVAYSFRWFEEASRGSIRTFFESDIAAGAIFIDEQAAVGKGIV
jgi:hypothetical protein